MFIRRGGGSPGMFSKVETVGVDVFSQKGIILKEIHQIISQYNHFKITSLELRLSIRPHACQLNFPQETGLLPL